MSGDALLAWLDGEPVARIEQARGRLRLTYTTEALDRYPLGTPLLSLSLSLRRSPHTEAVVRPFLDGLLPEGEARRMIAHDLRVPDVDTYELTRALGKDCAGAIVISTEGDAAPASPTTTTAEPLTAEAIEQLVMNLRSDPLGVNDRVRVSLAGVQEKLVLTQMPDGRWGRPVDGTPSTHLLKPAIASYPDSVENEAFCMRIAKHLGLRVADVETTMIGRRKLIVVRRYDRLVGVDGAVERLHQEDFCQAFGLAPAAKYEEDGGPSLERVAAVLANGAAPDSLTRLLEAVTFNAMIGNGDAHAKNFSLLHHAGGALALAPLYDLMCTLCYGDERLAMNVDGVARTRLLTVGGIVNEAETWGVRRAKAHSTVVDILARAPAALATARGEIADVPKEIVATIDAQLDRLRAE